MKTSRRNVLAGLMLVLLAACAEPLVSPETSASIAVRNVTVDVSAYQGIRGREIKIAPERLQTDLTAALNTQLEASANGNTDVTVKVTKVNLVSPGQALVFGGNSHITAMVGATSINGTPVLAPVEVFASSEQVRLGGVIGAVSTPAADKDYTQTVNGFAKSVRKRLLGKE